MLDGQFGSWWTGRNLSGVRNVAFALNELSFFVSAVLLAHPS